jgi:polysaccharide pyruvyl transferase WcaK-like protein
MSRNGIYLYGYYGQGNLGDDLLMTSAVRMIRAVRLDAPIFVHCHDPARLPDLDDALVAPVAANAELADQSVSKPIRLIRHFQLLLKTFTKCDALVFGGGTVLQESRSPLSILVIAALVTAARLRGLKVVLLGAGLGELKTRAGFFAARHVLRLSTAAAFRDAESVARAKKLASGCTITLAADLVYGLMTEQDRNQAGPAGTVALSIQPSITGRSDGFGERSRSLLRALVLKLIEDARHVRLLVFESKPDGTDGIDDAAAWRSIVGDLLDEYPARLTLSERVSDGTSVEDCSKSIFEGCSIHAGMRFHGHVLASLMRIPFVGLSNDIKITEICKAFSMPCLDMDSSTVGDVVLALAESEKEEVPLHTISGLRALCGRNLDVLKAVLGKG